MRSAGTIRSCVILAVAALAGCVAPDASSRAGGLTLEIAAEDTGNFAVLYRVEPDGTLGYGGGVAALADELTWTGRMTDAQIDTLRSLLEEHGWFEGPPASAPGTRETRIKMRWPLGRLNAKVRGYGPDLRAVEQYLDELARRRYESVLETLPKPSAN